MNGSLTAQLVALATNHLLAVLLENLQLVALVTNHLLAEQATSKTSF